MSKLSGRDRRSAPDDSGVSREGGGGLPGRRGTSAHGFESSADDRGASAHGCESSADDCGGSRDRLPSLDGLRAISVALVLINHSIPGVHSFLFHLLFLHSALGVNVFFVISGFLITNLLLREREETGGVSLRLFYIRRTLRILPAFCLFVGSVAILTACGVISVPAGNWIYVLTYTVNFDPHPPWVIGHLWSLSVEEQFYLLWPLVMKFARPPMWTAIALLSVFGNVLARAVHPAYPALQYAFPFVCGPIAMGCLLALHAPQARKLVARARFLLPVAVPVIALLDTIDLGNANRFIALITNFLVTLCVARVVFFPVGIAGKILNRPWLTQLGRLSYPLYLFQQLFLDSMGIAPLPLAFPLNCIAALAAAVICYRGVEARFLRMRKRFRSAAVPEAQATSVFSVPG